MGSVIERPIDRALASVVTGDAPAALALALPLVERPERSAIALFVVGRGLALLERPELAERAFSASARAAVDGSNLPLAVAAATELRGLGADPSSTFDSIARAFAQGSPRLTSRRVAPPDLAGNEPGLEPLAEPDAQALIAQAEAAIDAFEKRAREAPPVSRQALFSTLGREGLREMISMFEVSLLPVGALLVEEGTVGEQAFVIARGELEVEKRSQVAGEAPLMLARLGAGALVGEMALLSRAPRAATVRALRPTVVLSAHKTALDLAASRAPQIAEQFAAHCKRRMIENLMRSSAFFRSATAAERPALVERFSLRIFEEGELLATQGARGEGVHLIASGEVSVQHRDGADRTLVATLGPGDVVGEVALIFRRPAIADAVTTCPTVTLFLPESQLLGLVRDLPKVFASLYELAVERDQETADIVGEEASETQDFVIV